ncbi:hypothetical protein P879_11439 [Paragonimus westermani]|uniref:Uncharacterized protein n=1 Tax=Paragonimus westermani TaxID=34504 RepID=A0A8T0D7R0_9TREM|nr:hypothetical protein P879_11439 [Paragonimus westermani]
MGSPTKTDDSELPILPFNEGGWLPLADCHRPATKPSPSFDSDTNLPLWYRKVDLYLANIPNDLQWPYIPSVLRDKVREALWAYYLPTTATATSVLNRLEESYPVPGDCAGSRTTFWSRRQLLGETAEDYVNRLRALIAPAFPGVPKGKKDLPVLERFLKGTRDLCTRRRIIQEPPAGVWCAIRLTRSYAKATELVPERDGNCMTVEPQTTPILMGNRARVGHWGYRSGTAASNVYQRLTSVHEVLLCRVISQACHLQWDGSLKADASVTTRNR